MKNCSICKKMVDTESAPILAMGGFGNPRYLCDECAADIDAALTDRDSEKIENAMQRLSEKLAGSSSDDKVTLETVTEIFSKAGERSKAIKDGTYDFSLDGQQPDEMEEIPEELKETEEDAALDEKDAAVAKKIDKISNWITAGILALALAFFIIYLVM